MGKPCIPKDVQYMSQETLRVEITPLPSRHCLSSLPVRAAQRVLMQATVVHSYSTALIAMDEWFHCNVLPAGKGDSAVFSEDLFRKRCEVLKKCVEGVPELQLQVIYGIQVVLSQKQHPKGMWFRTVLLLV